MPRSAICYKVCMAGVLMRMPCTSFLHSSLEAGVLTVAPLSGCCPIRSLGKTPFAAAAFPAFITALTRLELLYARAVLPRS